MYLETLYFATDEPSIDSDIHYSVAYITIHRHQFCNAKSSLIRRCDSTATAIVLSPMSRYHTGGCDNTCGDSIRTRIYSHSKTIDYHHTYIAGIRVRVRALPSCELTMGRAHDDAVYRHAVMAERGLITIIKLQVIFV